MKKLTSPIFLLIAFLFSNYSYCQNIDEKVTKWAELNPIEKLYLHIDRESYYAGQTIWFKGYFMSDFIPSDKSTTVYTELVNEQSAIVVRNVFPAYMGVSVGQLDIPENTPAGVYQLRAYSPLMLNQPEYVFNKRIRIYGSNAQKDNKTPLASEVQLTFFAEGGNLITNLLNIVAFKATDKKGMPVNVEGEIRSETNELVTSFKSLHDGMGSFAIFPLPNGRYYATLKGSSKKYPLPEHTTNGVLFSVRHSSKGKMFRIVPGNDDPAFQPAYMIGQMENEILFKQPFGGNRKEISGIIPTDSIYSGILQLTVFNNDGMPLAERLVFINNKEYILPAKLNIDTLNVGNRQRNRFSIALKDSVVGNFSVSITDADYESSRTRPLNIYSWVLLGSHIRGYVHNPAYYFSSDNDSVREALDLVMMTNGWTRFKWIDVAQNKLPQPKYKDPGYINLSNTVYIEGRKKVLPNTDILVMISPDDTTQKRRGTSSIMQTDSLGQLRIDSAIFFGKMKILFSEVRGKKSKFINVKLHNDSLRRTYPIEWSPAPFTDSTAPLLEEKMITAFNDYLKAEGKTLEAVTVRSYRKSETEKLDEEYASPLFSGNMNSRILDLREETYAGDIFQYLQGRLPGLSITGSAGEYTIQYRGGGLEGSNVTLFLDEMRTDALMIESIPVNQIAMVKLIPTSIATPGGGTALAIYTKRGAGLNAAIDSPTDIITYNGYTIIKEFYNPDYDTQPDNDKVDNRLTLSWTPDIYVAQRNPTIPIIFYNNDRTKRFKVVVEGITYDGKMLMVEQIIEPGGD